MPLTCEKDLKVELLSIMKSESLSGVFGIHGLFDEFKIVGEESIFGGGALDDDKHRHLSYSDPSQV